MILIGQYDSPFVRRVAVTLHCYEVPFERRVLSVFTDFDAMLTINPLGKVPVLQLDDGERLFDSRAILDYLDSLVAPDRRLTPPGGKALRAWLRICATRPGKTRPCDRRTGGAPDRLGAFMARKTCAVALAHRRSHVARRRHYGHCVHLHDREASQLPRSPPVAFSRRALSAL